MIKVGTKAKVVIGIINTHFSIYPSNEAFLFILSVHQKNFAEPVTAPFTHLYNLGGVTKDVNKYSMSVQRAAQ